MEINKIPGTYNGHLDGIPEESSEMIKELNKSNSTKEINMDNIIKKNLELSQGEKTPELSQWKRIPNDYNTFINNLTFALIDAAEKKLKCLYVTKDEEYNGQIIAVNITTVYPSRQKRFVITIETDIEIGNLKMEVFAHEINWSMSGLMDKENEMLLLVNKNVNHYIDLP